jgi:TonB-linked SusC/RagA family outer membrane protein
MKNNVKFRIKVNIKMYMNLKVFTNYSLRCPRILLSVAGFMMLATFGLNAQLSVTGTVSDASGTLSGANVTLKGANVGVLSDADGRYSISVPGNSAVLVYSLMGYATQEIAVGSRTVIDVVLEEEAQQIDEVVVVGYGTQRKVDLAGSVATMNARDIETVPVGSLSNALAGRLTGVNVRSGTGGKPGTGAEVVIGSRGTWGNTSPLYVIDGVVRDGSDFNMLSSSDIEAFSVLKDASAAAVYGARAANGVFLVTTKKGKIGKPVITYSGSYSIGEPAFMPEHETFEQRYRIALATSFEMNNPRPAGHSITADGYQPSYTSQYDAGTSHGYINTSVLSDEAYEYYKNHQYDRLMEVYHTPVTQTHSLNVSGGSENVKYYIGGNYYNETGMFKAVEYKKHSIRSNVDAKITKHLTASLSVNLGNDNNQNALNDAGNVLDDRLSSVYNNLMRSTRLAPGIINGQYVKRDLSSSAPTSTVGTENNDGNTSYAAWANGDAGIMKYQRWFMEYTAALTWEIPWVKGLSAKASYNRYTRHNYQRSEPRLYEVYALLRGSDANSEFAKAGGVDPLGNIVVPELGAHATRGTLKVMQSDSWNNSYQLNTQLAYANTFGKHALEGVLVYEQHESRSEWLSGGRPNLSVSDLPFLNMGGGTTKDKDSDDYYANGSGSEGGRISYVGRFGYTYDNRYQASFSFREDLSSIFGPTTKQRKGFFPAGNVYWRISEESFVRNNVSWLSNLKLRASIGLTGNDNISSFQYLNTAKFAGVGGMYWDGTSVGQGISFSSIANPSITWEKSLNYNAGLDLGLFNMFNLSANLWKKHTYDILGSQTSEIPDTFGGSVAYSNYGIVDSYGFDLEIGFNKKIGNDAAVWARGNFSWADNKLIEYAEAGVFPHLSKIGTNYDRFQMWKSDGIVHDMRQQLDASGQQVTHDYNDGNGPQPMYVVKTSTGNTYVVPKNYVIADRGRWIDEGGGNNLRPGCVFPVDLGGMDADGNITGPDGHYDESTPADKTWGINRLNPPINYGLTLGGSWKGISLEVLLQGSAGNQNYIKFQNMASRSWDGVGWNFWSENMYSAVLNPSGTMPMMVNGPSDANNSTDFWTRDASFLRLKNVTLAYELPKSLLSKVMISGAKVFVSAQNVCFLYNAFKFFDPEMTGQRSSFYNDPASPPLSTGSSTTPDSGVMNYPLMRTVTFGLTLSF